MQLREFLQVAVFALLPWQSTALSPGTKGNFKSVYPEPESYREHPQRAAAIKEAFRFSWASYHKYAFPGDTLRPVAKEAWNDRNGWGVTAIDSLSTAILMEEQQIVDEILGFVPQIDWRRTSTSVNLFETTIRYLGGLLSGFDLLVGPYKNRFSQDDDRVMPLLLQAKELGEMLKYAFYTPTAIPDNEFTFSNQKARQNVFNSTSLAVLGTLLLEWTKLSDLLETHSVGGDNYTVSTDGLVRSNSSGKHCHFAELAYQSNRWLWYAKKTDQPFPGLLGTNIDVRTGRFLDRSGGWNGGTDSYYEYLLKLHLFDKSRFGPQKDLWIKAADSTMKHLLSRPSSKPNSSFVHVAGYSQGKPYYMSGHLACFVGGNFIQGGAAFHIPQYVKVGLAMVEGCREVYKNTATGIGPEMYSWRDAQNRKGFDHKPPADQQDFYEKNGYWISEGRYVLRPEVIEGYYYAYKVTGDTKYQEWAWEAFQAISVACRTKAGFVGIKNVNSRRAQEVWDVQESYWMAETLKYSYLIQKNVRPDVQKMWKGEGDWVFTTEGHPLRKPCTAGMEKGWCREGKDICPLRAKNPWA